MNWQRHYTGIEIAEVERRRVNLYMQRDERTRRMTFARISWPKYHMVGIFIGRGNCIKGIGGFEVFNRRWAIGWVRESWSNKPMVQWGGSTVDPYRRVTIRLGRFGISRDAPMWVQRWKRRIEDKKWEDQAAEYEEYLKARGWDAEYTEADDH
jgi:hypothetical protein